MLFGGSLRSVIAKLKERLLAHALRRADLLSTADAASGTADN